MKGKKGSAAKGVVAKDKAPGDVYAGAASNVVKEAKEGKSGGKVEGKAPKRRFDRPGRKTGGRVGADSAPLSSAARTTDAIGHKTEC